MNHEEISGISLEELRALIIDAAQLSSSDQRRLREIEKLDIANEAKVEWIYFSVMAARGFLHAYRKGELSLERMMRIAWNCSLPLGSRDLGFQYLGAVAAIASKMSPKSRNSKKPPFPTWIKKAAVQFALLLEDSHPNLRASPNLEHAKLDCVPYRTLNQLRLFDLHIGEGGNPITEKTIYGWINAHKRTKHIAPKRRGRKKKVRL